MSSEIDGTADAAVALTNSVADYAFEHSHRRGPRDVNLGCADSNHMASETLSMEVSRMVDRVPVLSVPLATVHFQADAVLDE
jgi:hypothetical protein